MDSSADPVFLMRLQMEEFIREHGVASMERLVQHLYADGPSTSLPAERGEVGERSSDVGPVTRGRARRSRPPSRFSPSPSSPARQSAPAASGRRGGSPRGRQSGAVTVDAAPRDVPGPAAAAREAEERRSPGLVPRPRRVSRRMGRRASRSAGVRTGARQAGRSRMVAVEASAAVPEGRPLRRDAPVDGVRHARGRVRTALASSVSTAAPEGRPLQGVRRERSRTPLRPAAVPRDRASSCSSEGSASSGDRRPVLPSTARREDTLLRKRILKPGLGEASMPLPGQEVTVFLIGILEDGSLVEKDPKLTFILDEGDVIQALELGVRGMQLGEVAFMLTNGLYAFGLLGRNPDIPSEASLLYKVTLLQVRDKPSLGILAPADRISLGNQKRECGNFHFEREEYRSAMHSYSQALSILTPNSADPLSSEEEEEIREHRIKCLNNLAATQLKLHHFDDVINSCNAVLEMDVNNAKALYRKGKVLSDRGDYETAMAVLKQALKLEPTTKAIHSELSKLVKRQKGQTESNKSPLRPKSKAHLKLRDDLNPLIRHSTKQRVSNKMLMVGAMVAAVLSLVTAFIFMQEK